VKIEDAAAAPQAQSGGEGWDELDLKQLVEN
jgi:hypothetical protein